MTNDRGKGNLWVEEDKVKSYSLPTNADPEVLSKTWTRPEVLRARLGAATLATPEQLTAISEAISSLRCADTGHDALLTLLLQYQETLCTFRPKLNNRLVGLMLPPNKEDVELYHQCSQIYANLAAVCGRIIREAPRELHRNNEDLAGITQACYWAIRFLGERLRCAYCSYTQAPPEIWLEIHQIYQRSLRHGIAKDLVRDGSKLRHITHIYKRMLLFGICDPYQFPFRSVDGVFKALDDWAKLAHLRLGKPSKDQCLFLINPNADRPAVPMLPKLSMGVDTLYLVTSPLIDVLNLDLNTHQDLQFKNNPQQLVKELETREILKNLIVGWGVHPSRESARDHSDGTCDLVIGLSSVTALINLAHGQVDDCRLHIRKGLQLIDESTSGARLCVKGNDETHVRVGELVAMKSPHAKDWSIGMIRWGQTDSDNKFYIGIYKFVDNATPVVISVYNDRNKIAFGPERGIWAVTIRTKEKGPTLIADTRCYGTEQTMGVKRGDAYSFFETGRVVLSTRYFVWFELNPLNSNPMKTSD